MQKKNNSILLMVVFFWISAFQLGCSNMTGTNPLDGESYFSGLNSEELLKSELLDSIESSSIVCHVGGVDVELAYAVPFVASDKYSTRILIHGGHDVLESRDNLSEELANTAINDGMLAISMSIDFADLELGASPQSLVEGFACINDWVKKSNLNSSIDYSHVELIEASSSKLSDLLLETKDALLELKQGIIEGNVQKQLAAGIKIVRILKGNVSAADVLKLLFP